MATISVPRFVIADAKVDANTGATQLPAAGTVPTADGSGRTTWLPPSAGSTAGRYDLSVDQVVYDDGVTQFVWLAEPAFIVFRSASDTWYGSSVVSFYRQIIGDNDGELSASSVGSFPLSSSTDFQISYPQPTSYSLTYGRWSFWAKGLTSSPSPLFEGVVARSGSGEAIYGNVVVTRK